MAAVLAFGMITLTGAAAVPAVAVPAVDPLPIPGALPMGSKAKLYMLNVLGSVLKGATPNKWQREQLALANTYNSGFETLDQLYGFDTKTGVWAPGTAPQTIEEYNMQRLELGTKGSVQSKGGKTIGNGSIFKPPATKGGVFQKIVGGVGVGIPIVAAAATGFQIGKAYSASMGFNVDGGLCGSVPNDFGSAMVGLVTGTDCEAYWTIPAEFTINADIDYLALGGNCETGTLAYGVANGTVQAPRDATCRSVPLFARARPSGPSVQVGAITLESVTVESATVTRAKFRFHVVAAVADTTHFGATTSNFTARCYNTSGNTVNNSTPAGAGLTEPAGSSGGVKFGWTLDNQKATGDLLITTKAPTCTTLEVIVGTGLATGNSVLVARNGMIKAADVSGDPERTWRCQMTYTDGTTASKQTSPWKESARDTPPVDCPGAGTKTPAKIDVYKHTVADGAETLWYSEDVTDEYSDMAETYPECLDGSCKLDLLVKSSGQSCFDNETACASWFEESDKATKYQCRYGTHDVELSECYVYSGIFQPSRVTTGSPYSDPETGAWSGGKSAEGQDAGTFGAPVQDPTKPRECFPTGWAMVNPLEWVMKPVGCALERAFVPRQAVIDNATANLELEWGKTGPAKSIAAIGGIGSTLGGLSDGTCGGLPVNLSGLAPNVIHLGNYKLLAACEGDFFHDWAIGVKALLVLSLTFAGFIAIKAVTSRTVGL